MDTVNFIQIMPVEECYAIMQRSDNHAFAARVICLALDNESKIGHVISSAGIGPNLVAEHIDGFVDVYYPGGAVANPQLKRTYERIVEGNKHGFEVACGRARKRT